MSIKLGTVDLSYGDLSGYIKTTGNETIAGVKTFSSSPIVPTPTTDMQVATKKYVDDNAGGGESTQSTFVAGENITAGNALYIHTDGKAYKTDASNSSKINFIGFATNTVSTGGNVIVDTSGVSATQSGLTVGSDYYLGESISGVSNSSTIQQLTGTNSGGAGSYFGQIAANIIKQGQSFTTITDRVLRNISLRLKKVGTPTNNIVIKLFAFDKTTLIATSTTFLSGAGVTTSYAEYTFNFSDILLSAGTQYFIEASVDTNNSNTDYYEWAYISSNPYSGGQQEYYNGTTWNTFGYDHYFNIQMGTGTIKNISTTPGTNIVSVGKAVSTTGIQILNSDLYTQNRYDVIGFTRTANTSSGSVVYNHNLGKIPKMITFNGSIGSNLNYGFSGGYVNGTNKCVSWAEGGTNPVNNGNYCIVSNNTTYYGYALVTNVTSTTFTLTWTAGNQSTIIGILATLIA